MRLYESSSFSRPSPDVESTLSLDSTGFANLLRNPRRCLAAANRSFRGHYRTGSQSKKQSILLLVEVEHHLILSHVHISYGVFLRIIGRFTTGTRLSPLVRPAVEVCYPPLAGPDRKDGSQQDCQNR